MRGQWANKRDANEPEIVQTLQAFGYTVERMDKPVDLAVGKGGKSYLIEVKGKRGKLTAEQERFFRDWRGHVEVLRSRDEAEKWARNNDAASVT